MNNFPILGSMDENGNVDGVPFNEFMKNAFKEIQGSSAYSWDRNRPYNGQPQTNDGERGKTLVEGLTVRDVGDCFVAGLLDCCGFDQPELYAQADKPLHDLIYKVNFDHIDPGAWLQNMMCRIEKMMGIYPNVPELIIDE